MLRKVRKAAAGVDDVAVVAEMIGTGFRTAIVGNRVGGTKLSAGAAAVAELRDARVDWRVDRKRNGRRNAAHPEQRTEHGMNDRSVAAELAKAGLQSNRNVQEIAVADRMFDLAFVSERTDMRGKLN